MLFINTINEKEVLNSYNFARQADVVYSEIISRKNFEKINKENLQKLFEDKHYLPQRGHGLEGGCSGVLGGQCAAATRYNKALGFTQLTGLDRISY